MSNSKNHNTKRRNPIFNLLITEWQYLGNRKKIYILYIFLFFLAGIVSLATPFLVGTIFNTIQQNINSLEELKSLIFQISLLLLINIFFWIFHGTARVIEQNTGFYVARNYINSKIFKVFELPIEWHKDNHSGDTIDKINKATGGIGNFSSYTTFSIVYAITNLFGSVIILFFIDKFTAIFALVFSSIVLFLVSRIDRKLDKKYQEINKYENKAAASVFDYISNILTVITLKLKKRVSREIDRRILASYKTTKSSNILNELKWAFASISISIMIVVSLSIKAYNDYLLNGIILIGTLYMLYGYLNRVGDTFYNFASLYGTMVRQDADLVGARVIDEEYYKIQSDIKGRLSPNWKKIRLRNLSFMYNIEGENKHIDNINLDIIRNKRIALVGESGSGKSTILSLIRGLYKPNNGKLYCDNIVIKNGFSKLKNHVTLIPQDPEIFNNTIKYNITLDAKTKLEDLNNVIDLAQFNQVEKRLEKGIYTNVLEKGVSLSGGEKQRLALARGLLAAKDSDIILLDEPTSSVDALNELKIYTDLFIRFKHKTIISSIHRLHLLNKFDYIYVFDNGRIITQGTLKDIKNNPKFSKIWKKYTREIRKR